MTAGTGIVVSKISEGGPAAKTGGLCVHDRIMKVKKKINSTTRLVEVTLNARSHRSSFFSMRCIELHMLSLVCFVMSICSFVVN